MFTPSPIFVGEKEFVDSAIIYLDLKKKNYSTTVMFVD
jgi:hypothetical protein